jgi:G6PDH family F420-dependent oxidoreductase
MRPLTIGYAAMLEQLAPAEAVGLAAYAESRGFHGVMASDHFQPWIPAHGTASFVWSVLAALAERTTGDFGPGMTTPGYRMHPAVVAQASATLASLYPGRHWLGIGSGEAMNEHVVAGYWPQAPERINRMFEAVEIIEKLFAASLAGKDAKYAGQYYKMESTRLWGMLERPLLLIATAGPVTAKRAGRHADGFITPGASVSKTARLIERFAAGAREAGRDPGAGLKVLQLDLSWASTDEDAMANAIEEWPNGAMSFPKADIRSPFEFEQIARHIRPSDFGDRMVVSSDPEVHRLAIQRFADLGFDRIYLHNAGRNQREFIDVFATEVLPRITR